MKNKSFLNMILCSALAISLVFVQSSCDFNDDDDMVDNDFALSGTATGAQEVPPNASTGTATLTGNYNSTTNTLSYTINWSGLSGNLTAAHFHGPALPGVDADPIHDISITSNGTSGTASGTLIIADSTESHLFAGKLYYNLHNALFPGGEVRAQVATNN